MATTPEGRVKDMIKKFLKRHGVWYFMPVQSGYGSPSLDFLCCYRGHFFAIEAKAPGKKPTPRQNLTMQEMRKAGAATFVVSCGEDLTEVIKWVYTVE